MSFEALSTVAHNDDFALSLFHHWSYFLTHRCNSLFPIPAPALNLYHSLLINHEAVLADLRNRFVVTNTRGTLDAPGFIRTQLTN